MSPVAESYLNLTSLGEIVALQPFVSPKAFGDDLKKVPPEKWKRYNPRKPNNNRWGLPLTSLDGGDTGVPDLDSVKEYNHIYKTSYREMDFCTPTPNYAHLSCFHPIFELFSGFVGRSHVIRLDEGGFFPPHRDLMIEQKIFRLLLLGPRARSGDLVIIHKNKKIDLLHGQLYFFNTNLSHSLFSFVEGAMLLVMNVELTEQSVRLVHQNLMES